MANKEKIVSMCFSQLFIYKIVFKICLAMRLQISLFLSFNMRTCVCVKCCCCRSVMMCSLTVITLFNVIMMNVYVRERAIDKLLTKSSGAQE